MVDICKGAFLKLDDKVRETKLRQFWVKICGEAGSKCAATHRHRNSRCWVGLQSELQRRKRMLPVNRGLVKRPSHPQGKDQYSSWSLRSYNSITSSQTCPSGFASTSPHSPRQPTEKRSWRSSRPQRWANNNNLFSQYTKQFLSIFHHHLSFMLQLWRLGSQVPKDTELGAWLPRKSSYRFVPFRIRVIFRICQVLSWYLQSHQSVLKCKRIGSQQISAVQ